VRAPRCSIAEQLALGDGQRVDRVQLAIAQDAVEAIAGKGLDDVAHEHAGEDVQRVELDLQRADPPGADEPRGPADDLELEAFDIDLQQIDAGDVPVRGVAVDGLHRDRDAVGLGRVDVLHHPGDDGRVLRSRLSGLVEQQGGSPAGAQRHIFGRGAARARDAGERGKDRGIGLEGESPRRRQLLVDKGEVLSGIGADVVDDGGARQERAQAAQEQALVSLVGPPCLDVHSAEGKAEQGRGEPLQPPP
jgi:hypothetical protein